MKKPLIILIFLLLTHLGFAQQDLQFQIDSLRFGLSQSIDDSSRMEYMGELANYYKFDKPDSTIFYGIKTIELSRKINLPRSEAFVLHHMSLAYSVIGVYSKALELSLQGIKLSEINSLAFEKSLLLLGIGNINRNYGNFKESLHALNEAKILCDSLNSKGFSIIARSNIGLTYNEMNEIDSAFYYGHLANEMADRLKVNFVSEVTRINLGIMYSQKGDLEKALYYFKQALAVSVQYSGLAEENFKIAQVYQQLGKIDSSIIHAERSLRAAKSGGGYRSIINSNLLLSENYKKRDFEKALRYSNTAIAYMDSLELLREKTVFEAMRNYDEVTRENEIETAKTAYQNKVKQTALFIGLGVVLLIAFILFRNDRQKKKANNLLAIQKSKVEAALTELKSTQKQLIQSEKMASLGELTAGIAHEIQNPLNFVNNFSEVSEEMLEEMDEELDKGEIKVAKEISADLKQNLQKINHHGNRASSIVKGMLEHSQTSTGEKVPTDINALADEYLRLAYHGLRAKDKDFQSDFQTDFDENLPKVNVIPQDIGRVLLNLINNAFQACAELSPTPVTERSRSDKPLVTISTKLTANRQLQIAIKDNGPDIPEAIKDKIFQPFFTTKPTGKGTGLGLSLAYDIVKAHGGELTVKSVKGKGAEFIIQIPISANKTEKP